MSRTQTSSERISEVTDRLEEIERQRFALGSLEDPDSIEELIEEEHRLQALLQDLADRATEDGEGIAEELVKAEGSNADEVPDLPPDPGDVPAGGKGES